jgi:hypothetical protein
MGSDGSIMLYSRERMDKTPWLYEYMEATRINVYTRTIFGHRIVTEYGDTSHSWLDQPTRKLPESLRIAMGDTTEEQADDLLEACLLDETECPGGSTWEVWS